MKRGKALRIIWAGIVVVCLFLYMPASAGAADKVDIRIVGMMDMTGPYAAMHAPAIKVYQMFIDWANKTDYVPGVNIITDTYDHAMDISKAVAAYQMAMAKKPTPAITCGGYTSATILAIKPLAKRNHVPCLDGSSARNILRPAGWAFSMQAQYEGMTGATGDWIKANWKPDSKYEWIRKHYENRKPRMAVVGWDNAFGRGFDQKESRAYIESKGVEFVGAEYIPMSPSDTSPQVLRLVNNLKADFIFFGMYPSSHAIILKDAARLGIRDKFQDVGCFYDNIGHLSKYAGDLAEGSMQITSFQCIPDQWPEPMQQLFKETGFDAGLGMTFASIITYYDTYCEVLRRAAKKVGAENVNGEVCYDVLTNFDNFKPMCSIGGMSFTKTKLAGIDSMGMYQIQDGKMVLIQTGIYVPDLLPDGKDVPR